MFDPTLEAKERRLLEMMWPYGCGVRALRAAKATSEDLAGLVARELAVQTAGGYDLTDRGMFATGHLWGRPSR